jgi:hypothetical protein
MPLFNWRQRTGFAPTTGPMATWHRCRR